MGTTVRTMTISIVMFAVLFLFACAPKSNSLNSVGVVQSESSPPVQDPPANAGDIDDIHNPPSSDDSKNTLDTSYNTLRVRVFPILSVPSQDPYPKTADPYNVSLSNSNGLEIYENGNLIGVYKNISIDGKNEKISLDGKIQNLRIVAIHAKDISEPTVVSYDKSVKVSYRGAFYIVKTAFDTTTYWSTINYVSIDDYLFSVVPSEMPSYFAFEALRAQAVTARTYSLFHAWLARNTNKTEWDVDPTTWYQSYRGTTLENAKTITPAVVSTSGLVITYSNKIIEAFFSANSGGMVCSVKECFDLPNRPYVVTKPDVDGVRLKPSGTWQSHADSSGIDARLKLLDNLGQIDLLKLIPGYSGPSDIIGLEAHEVGAAGRVARLAVKLANGGRAILDKDTTKNMRWQFGMKSAYYELGTPKKGSQDITGYGLGHGVGMSQWGARILADQGKTFEEIIKFYYHNVSIDKL